MDRSAAHRGLVAAAMALVLLFSCVPAAAAATSGTVTYGCSPVNHNDTSAWLSVSRGLFRGSVYQYWLSQSYAYLTHVQQDIVGTSTWPLPPTVTPINGLVLSVNWTPYGFYDSVRVLLQDAQNCVYDYDIPTLKPWAYTLLHRHCYNASLPLWTKIVPDNINNMDQVKYIYLVSLDYVAALSFNTTLPTTTVKIPRGDVPMTSVVGASYQSNHGNDDQLYIIRSNDSPSKPSEILNFVVDTAKQGPDLRFGHVTYLEGESDTLFTNDNSTQLLWTQVVPNWQNTGATQGVLFDYSLQAPRFFRRGELDFSGSPNAKWGTHAFSRVPGVEAMMITTANQTNSAGFDIHVVYLNADLPSLSFVDSLTVTDSTLPSLGQAIEFRDQWADFAVMMATHSVDGYTCLQLFIHCIADLTLCYGTMRPL